jgi:hypothetical protein
MTAPRSYRKAVSFITVGGRTYRLTDGFASSLALTIGRAQNMLPTDVHHVLTTTGSTPMTLGELYELRDAISKLHSDALKTEVVANG